MKIRRRLPDGSYGDLEEIFPEATDSNLLAAFEAIAMQGEMIFEQQSQIEAMKIEIETLKGGAE